MTFYAEQGGRTCIDAAGVLSAFTSLGDNCEFALVQRRAGVEKLSLLRFAFTKIAPLVEAVEDGFADLDPLDHVTIEQPWSDEYVSFFGRRGFFQHTFKRTGSISPEALRQQEMRRIPYLRRMLLEQFSGGETIFVRKSQSPDSVGMMALHRALRRYGPTYLLWVEPSDEQHPPGTVEQVGDGLMRGFLDRFAPYGDATSVSFDGWLRVCVRAYRLVNRELPPPPRANSARAKQAGADEGIRAGVVQPRCRYYASASLARCL